MEQQNDMVVKCDNLLPAAERTALMFHMCYLYLSGYPEQEKMIRERALNARLLFVSTETIVFKSVCTSDNLVKTLFPIIKVAMERDSPEMAKTYLQKAEDWITEIITAVQEMVNKYEDESKTLEKITSEIYAKCDEKKSTDAKITQFEKDLEQLEQQLKSNTQEQIAKKKEIDTIETRLIDQVEAMSEHSRGLAEVMSGMSFFSKILYLMATTRKTVFGTFKTLTDKHWSEMATLRKTEEELENEMMKKRMELMKVQIEQGTIPSPRHLEKVKESLCKIQTVLMGILSFWKHVGVKLNEMKKKTFAGNKLMEEIEKFKEIFLRTVEHTEQEWVKFGQSCRRAKQMFEVQSRDAFKFLEMTPSSLSADDWQRECTRLDERLHQICQRPGTDGNY